jgi:transcriptional regulator with XRE-family HTH domain
LPFDQKAFYRDVGLRLQVFRKRRELTQEEVATQLGVSRASYANVEAGRQRASLDLMWKLSVVLAVPISDFVPEPLRASYGRTEWPSASLGEGSSPFRVLLPSKNAGQDVAKKDVSEALALKE